jgi:5'-3' exonuclease
VPYRILLDTSSLMYRAFFSIPPTVRTAGNQPTNAMHGYLDMVATLIGARKPDEVVHVYDEDWRPAPRVALYEGYKGNRQPDPEGLPEQFVILRKVLDALGQSQAEAPGWEAEDAVGALCRTAPEDIRSDIVTGDRDLIQLVRDPAVRVLFTVKGVTDLRVLDEKGVLERFGVPAPRYAEFAILRGDPSDGLPGVRGVGEKTARSLVNAYPSIEAMVRAAAWSRESAGPLQRSPSLRSAIRDAADYLEKMEDVAQIRTDVEVRAWHPKPDDELLEALTERYRLTGPVRRFRAAADAVKSGRSDT